MNLLRRHQAAAAILTLFVVLGVTYSIIVPIFEAPDELYHYPFVARLAQGEDLPVQRPGHGEMWQQEGSQPPLYYVLASVLNRWLDLTELPAIYRPNPHARVGIPLAHDNKNIVIHTDRETFPWRGAVLGIHLTRLFSLLLAVGTLLCTYHLGQVIFSEDRRVAIAALAFNAFIPMFMFISASVNNDNLVIFLSSLTLTLLVRVIRRGAPPRALLLIGIIIGLACLAKLGALALIPLAGLALLLRYFDERAPTSRGLRNVPTGQGLRNAELVRRVSSNQLRVWLWRLAADYALVLLPILVIAGWWYVRNWQLYGDPTGLNAMLDIVGRRPARPSLLDLWDEFEGLRINFWGLFGVVNVLLRPTWIYRVFDALTILAMIGAPLWVWLRWRMGRSVPWRDISLLSAWMLVEFGALIRWTSETFASQGRLFFPALAPICLFLAAGWLVWFPPRWQGRAALGLAAMFLALTATAPLTSILPAYTRPAILTTAEIPPTARRFDVTYGDVVRLVAFEVGKDAVRPGEELPVTVYWEALKPMAEDLSIFVQLVAGQDTILGQTDSYPGGGAYPTSMWSPGEVIRDQFMVPIRRGTNVPEAASLLTGIYHYKTLTRLPAVDGRGQMVTQPVLARVKVAVPTQTQIPQHILHANLADRVRLIGYDLPAGPIRPGTDVRLTLYWEVLGRVGGDYTVFIHLLDASDVRVGQGDGPPLNNAYPTSFWAAGESLADAHRLTIPANAAPGRYRIAVGLYDPISGQRLPMLDPQGKPAADRVMLGDLEVALR